MHCRITIQDKSRLTVLLATNATGSHKLRPLVIGKSKKPRSFKGIKISQLPVMYENNERAWMKSDIWEKWLTFHDKGFRIQNKKVLLIVDNARSHSEPEMPASSDDNRDQRPEDNVLGSKDENGENFISESSKNDEISNSEGNEDDNSNTQPHERARGRTHIRTHRSTHRSIRRRTRGRPRTNLNERASKKSHKEQNNTPSKFKLTNIKLHYLPPNTTAHLQPLDAGIIRSFKSKYKNLYCKHVLNQFESNIDLEELVL